MYATLNMYVAKPGTRDKMERVADEMLSKLSSMRGFRSVTFVLDPETNEYGGFALWETKEDAEAAKAATEPGLEAALGDVLTAPPVIRWFDVYEPKG